MRNLLSTALPPGLLFFPVLLIFIGLLLFGIASIAFYVKHTLSLRWLQVAFLRWPGVRSNGLASLLGAATPFCTCTAVPLFLGMLEVEIPLGPAISFLLASPTINLGAVILLFVLLGWRTALFYSAGCLLAAVVVGWLLGHIPREQAVRDYLWLEEDEPSGESRRVALRKALLLGGRLTRKFLPWLVLATLVGIVIDTLIPNSIVIGLGQWGTLIGIVLAALLGSVIYADILFLIPMGMTLIRHGISVPIVLTFMVAASGLSLAEVIVLGKILRWRVVVVFMLAALLVYILLGWGLSWIL